MMQGKPHHRSKRLRRKAYSFQVAIQDNLSLVYLDEKPRVRQFNYQLCSIQFT